MSEGIDTIALKLLKYLLQDDSGIDPGLAPSKGKGQKGEIKKEKKDNKAKTKENYRKKIASTSDDEVEEIPKDEVAKDGASNM